MARTELRRGGLAKLFHGATNSYLTVDPGGVRLAGDGGPTCINFTDLQGLARQEAGLFWARITLTSNTETFSLGGFPKAETGEFIGAVNALYRLTGEKLLKSATAPLAEVAHDIDRLLAGDHYVRSSQRRGLAKRTKEVMGLADHPLWNEFASPQQRSLLTKVKRFSENSEEQVERANERFVAKELERHKQFFDTIETKPLTAAQRRACVVCEDNNLVLAGAGTGKTSTMMGRAGYLLVSGQAEPDQLLMLAFARKAAGEMQERQDDRLGSLLNGSSPKIKTFHALGLEIIGSAEGARPSVTPLAEDARAFAKYVSDEVDRQCLKEAYRRLLVTYLGTAQFPYRSAFDFANMAEYQEYVRTNELRTLQGELVKSFEEVVVANFLTIHGIEYVYERNYEVATWSPDYRQYKPDFYLPRYHIYIEHFALDEHGNAPAKPGWERYKEGVEWKRHTHAEHHTVLVETYSFMQRLGTMESALIEKLTEAGVQLDRRRDEEILEQLRKTSTVSLFAEMLGGFLTLFKQSGISVDELQARVSSHPDRGRLTLLIRLFTPVLDAYEAHLQERGEIDFNDMINRATAHVRASAYRSPLTHIMVDEFQDISGPRAELVNALRGQRDDAVVFTVGDDWQAIYRFAGSDIGYTRDFEHHFGATATTALDMTFRFNDQLGKVSSAFVLKNPSQMRKNIQSLSSTPEPSVSLVRILRRERGLELALTAIERRVADSTPDGSASVLVLGRYHFELDDLRKEPAIRDLVKDSPHLKTQFSTVHAAKGKEADYVIVVGLGEGKYGFPCEVPNDEILELLLPPEEAFPHAEERRLFYVALTRARHRVYLAYNPLSASSFIHELLDAPAMFPITTDEFDGEDGVHPMFPRVRCPACKSGFLVPRESQYGSFFGCSHFPHCDYRSHPCPQCRGMMETRGESKVCITCGGVIPICPKCGGDMVERTGPYGTFWGCRNYRGKPHNGGQIGDDGYTCTGTRKM
jgi:DNA helicase-4